MQSVLPSLVELLFKYRPVVFDRGEFGFGAGRPAVLVVLGLGLLGAGVLWSYRRIGGRTTPRGRVLLIALRGAALALLLVLLLRPVLVVSTAVPERNAVGILLDGSVSMALSDEGEGRESRAAIQARLFGDPGVPVPAALAERFQLRWFRFARGAERIGDPALVTPTGGRSDLGLALDDARRDLGAVPLAALVLVSDGADNADSSVTRAVLAAAAAGIPVHTVMIGRDRLHRDLELVRLDAPRATLTGSNVLVEALVRQSGAVGDSAELVVEEDGRIVARRRFATPGDGQATAVRLPVALSELGARTVTARVTPIEGEAVTRNNERRLLVSVVDREERILYFEGEPRFEFAFLRRAAEPDSNLRVVGLQRTARNKYLRLGVEDSLDLLGGFPRSREELYRYRGLILGSVEASEFTGDQLRMVGDFVSRRGGGLLLLGGRRAFTEGGYRDTPLEDVMPVILGTRADTGFFRELRVGLTPVGLTHPVTQLGAMGLWDSLPPLSAVNPLSGVKPGATVILSGRDPSADGAGDQPVLASQRFGRGLAAALAVQDVWQWQMHASVPLEDQRFETFWRQVLRWLTSEVPDRVASAVVTEQVEPGEPIVVTAEVRDPVYEAVNGARVTAMVTAPSGEVTEVPLDWSVGTNGRYRGAFPAGEAGEYRIEVAAASSDDTLAAAPVFAAVGDVGREYFSPEARPALLRRIAAETGGRFYTAATVADLPRDIVYTERGITRTERLDLWDMPIVLITMLALLTGEWWIRRARGLA